MNVTFSACGIHGRHVGEINDIGHFVRLPRYLVLHTQCERSSASAVDHPNWRLFSNACLLLILSSNLIRFFMELFSEATGHVPGRLSVWCSPLCAERGNDNRNGCYIELLK